MEQIREEAREFAKKAMEWTYAGAEFYYRDAFIDEAIVDKYEIGNIVRHPFFVDLSSLGGGIAETNNTRYLIASSKAAPITHSEVDTERWGFHLLNANAYFKVLDVYKLNGKNQVVLLHIPAKGLGFFAELNSNYEKEIVEKARQMFNEYLTMPIIEALEEETWKSRIAMPIGFAPNGEIFSLIPENIPDEVRELYDSIKNKVDPENMNEFNIQE